MRRASHHCGASSLAVASANCAHQSPGMQHATCKASQPADLAGNTPLDDALARGNDAVVAMLCESGAMRGSAPGLKGRQEAAQAHTHAALEASQAARVRDAVRELPEHLLMRQMRVVSSDLEAFVQVRTSSSTAWPRAALCPAAGSVVRFVSVGAAPVRWASPRFCLYQAQSSAWSVAGLAWHAPLK